MTDTATNTALDIAPHLSTREERVAKAKAICGRISEGDKVSAACHAEGVPWRTYFEWKLADDEIAGLHARARKASGEAWADKATKEVEDASIPDVQLRKLRADHYAWRASVADRRGFGDHLDVTTDGEALRPSVVVLPALDKLPSAPADGITIEESRRVSVSGHTGATLAALLSDYVAGRLGPGRPLQIGPQSAVETDGTPPERHRS